MWLVCLAMLSGLLACGGHGGLEKAVRGVLVSGDTTRQAYDSLCSIVTDNPDRYSDLLTPEGTIDHSRMAALIDEIGSALRPPMHWDTRPYGGARDLSLTSTLTLPGFWASSILLKINWKSV